MDRFRNLLICVSTSWPSGAVRASIRRLETNTPQVVPHRLPVSIDFSDQLQIERILVAMLANLTSYDQQLTRDNWIELFNTTINVASTQEINDRNAKLAILLIGSRSSSQMLERTVLCAIMGDVSTTYATMDPVVREMLESKCTQKAVLNSCGEIHSPGMDLPSILSVQNLPLTVRGWVCFNNTIVLNAAHLQVESCSQLLDIVSLIGHVARMATNDMKAHNPALLDTLSSSTASAPIEADELWLWRYQPQWFDPACPDEAEHLAASIMVQFRRNKNMLLSARVRNQVKAVVGLRPGSAEGMDIIGEEDPDPLD